MRAHWKSWLVFALLVGTTAYCVAEQVMVYTNYPSPLGVYQELRATSNAYFATGGGNVGIGTTNPSAKLHVGKGSTTVADEGAIFLQSGNGAGGARDWKLYSVGTGNFGIRDMGFNNAGGGMASDALTIQYNTGNVGIGTPAPAYKLHANDAGGGTVALTAHSGTVIAKLSSTGTGGTPGAAVGTDSNHPFNLLTNGTARVMLDANGNVGIGTVPSSLLPTRFEIKGQGTTWDFPPGSGTPSFAFRVRDGADGGLFSIRDDGRVSTTTGSGKLDVGYLGWPWPGLKLNVLDTTSDYQIATSKNAFGFNVIYLAMGANEYASLIQSGRLQFPAADVTAPLGLQPNGGNVAINFPSAGPNAPRRPLDVWGEIVSVGGKFTLTPDAALGGPTWHIDNFSNRLRFFTQPDINTAGTEWVTILPTGNVGIGTATPDPYRLDVNGDARISGSLTLGPGGIIPADIAENMNCPDCEAGDVVVVDLEHDQRLTRSTAAYDPTFAGVISTKPALNIGGNRGESARPLALAGQVPCKVTTENGPIKRGDLLVTSSTPGHAMRADSESIKPGTLIGKALEPLAEGEGTILVLITGG